MGVVDEEKGILTMRRLTDAFIARRVGAMDPFEFDRFQTEVEDEGENRGLRPWINRRQFMKWAGLLGANTIFLTTAGRGWGANAQPGKPVPPFEAWYYTYPEWIEFWRYTPIDLKPLGIQIKPNSGTLITILGRVLRQRKYGDMVTFSWVANPERVDPNFWLKHLLHSKGGRNYVHYSNPEFDRVVEAQASEMDPEKRRELVWKAQEIAAKDHAKMYLAHPDEVHAYNDKDWADASPGLGAALNFGNIWHYLNFRPLKDRKVFRCAAIGDIDTLNIFNTSSGTNIQLLRFIYDPFVRYTTDFKVIPWAAESWDVVNPTTVDIVLRSGMKFHDGKPVTIADVKFTMDYLKKWNFPFFKFAVNYERTEVMGDRRLRFHLSKPHAGFVTVDLSFLVILPKHIWQDIPKRAGLADPRKWAVYPETVGTGPFKLKRWRKGEGLVMEANKEHFHPPKADGFIYRPVSTVEAQVGMLETGEIDMTTGALALTPEVANRLSERPNISVAKSKSYKLWYLGLNLKRQPFKDVEFRRALNHAIDRRKFVDIALRGGGTPAKATPISPVLQPWHNPNLPLPEFNIDKAREILKNAGYTWDRRGRLVMPEA
jgi:peptide/nickel transport system substrate-binding protein